MPPTAPTSSAFWRGAPWPRPADEYPPVIPALRARGSPARFDRDVRDPPRLRIGCAEALGRSGPGLCRLDLPVARRAVADKRVEQVVGRVGHLVHSAIEGGLVGLGGPREA